GSAPATLDTIQELAAALQNNEDVFESLLNTKYDKSGGTITGTVNISGLLTTNGIINIGSAADNGIITRGIFGATLDGQKGELFINYMNNFATTFNSLSTNGSVKIQNGSIIVDNTLNVSNVNILDRLNTIYNKYVKSVGGKTGEVAVKTLSSKTHLDWGSSE